MTTKHTNSTDYLNTYTYDFPNNLPLQFRISFNSKSSDNANTVKLSDVCIEKLSEFTHIFVYNFDGESIGVILGCPICINSNTKSTNDIHLESNLRSEMVPEFLSNYAGSYLFIYVSKNIKRIYPDANTTKPLVFSPELQVAASSPAAIFTQKEYFEKLKTEEIKKVGIYNIGWFPAGPTAHRGVQRLLTNHYLDLVNWHQLRFWPNANIEEATNPEQLINDIHEETTRILTTIVNNEQLTFQSLTAGYETRYLLSCACNIIDKLHFFTIESTKIDQDISKSLANKYSLNHKIIPKRLSTREELKTWLYRGGHAVGGTNLITHQSLHYLPENAVLSIGLGGEVGRGFFWKNKDSYETVATPNIICGRFGIKITKPILNATEDWLSQLPKDLNFYNILDLAYIELRMGCWAFTQAYSQDAIRQHYSPMITYNNYKRMLSLPPQLKRNNSVIIEGIRNSWEELLYTPINKYGGIKDLLPLLRKATNPIKLVSKFRKILS